MNDHFTTEILSQSTDTGPLSGGDIVFSGSSRDRMVQCECGDVLSEISELNFNFEQRKTPLQNNTYFEGGLHQFYIFAED